MRIIGGQYKGRTIIAPKGSATRPTTDRTRESLFNILAARDDVTFEGARVIDLFAGSGALGLEALSRGAAFCLFVDTSASARGAMRDNIEALSAFGTTRIHRRSATDLGAKPAGVGPRFTLAFIDPPYGQDLVAPALATLDKGGWLAPASLVIAEQRKTDPEIVSERFTEIDQRLFGDTRIAIYRYMPE